MNKLIIEQGNNIEVVTHPIILKLYQLFNATSGFNTAYNQIKDIENDPRPTAEHKAELIEHIRSQFCGDNFYLSGNLQVDKTKRSLAEPLTTIFKDLTITIQNYYIDFDNSVTENICVQEWGDKDGAGITEAQARTAQINYDASHDQYGPFRNNSDIITFNEFDKFESLNNNPTDYMFINSGLTSINLSNCTKISRSQFKNTHITTINAPRLETFTGYSSFQSCTSLTTIQSLGNVSSISNQCFSDCTNLENVDSSVFSKLTSIGQEAFLNDSKLSGTLSLPLLTSIGASAFYNCRISGISDLGSITTLPGNAFGKCSLTDGSFVIPNTVTTYSAQAICNGTQVTKIIMHEGVTTAECSQYQDSALEYLELPTTVTNMGNFFHRMAERNSPSPIIVIKATTPPALSYYGNQARLTQEGISRVSAVYVPDASLTAYQNAGGVWDDLVNADPPKLKPISDLRTDSPTYWNVYNRTSTV